MIFNSLIGDSNGQGAFSLTPPPFTAVTPPLLLPPPPLSE